MRIHFANVGGLALLLAIVPAARATTKGLNQIVTPDIQTAGMLSVSAQVQDSRIGNSQQLQFELGLARWAEISLFQGFRPGEKVFGAELGLVQQGPHLLTIGAVNWSSRGGGAQPILEYGYYATNDHFIAGAIYAGRRTEAVLGYSHQLTDKLLLAVDYQSGPDNAVSLGFTYDLTPDLQLNPAAYFANTSPHRALAYVVLTWNLPLWR